MRLTAKERVLLHLLESPQKPDAPEVSPRLAQEGVARGAGIELRHLAQFVRPLIREGLVRERVAHVVGIRQRRKVYDLTPSGRAAAIHLRARLKEEPDRDHGEARVPEGGLDFPDHAVGTKSGLLEAIPSTRQPGVIDIEAASRLSEPRYVEQTWDAPRIPTFVGRREELSEILREDRGPQVFVIRGVAGIGKTAFAAKVCDLLRGRRNLFWHRIRPWESDQTVFAGLGRFLETLDRPGLSAVLKRGQAGLIPEVLRQDLPDTHAVLVFDDAHESSEETLRFFRMLAEAVGSAPDVRVLILTRRAIPFYDVRDVAIHDKIQEIELGVLEADEVAALLAAGGVSVNLSGVGPGLAGLPLFIDLLRSHRYDVPAAVEDVQRFIGEAIYRGLTEAEKTAMKAVSLYRVPLPRPALLSVPGSSYETIVALQARSLIRSLGGDRYEVHDTIREFFEGVLTPPEREAFGRLALARLRELARAASSSGDPVTCVACLSNALRLAATSEDRRELSESLGDMNDRLGDVSGFSTAYREALKLAADPETAARLHRKLASALVDRGHFASAQEEAEAGFDALGDLDSVERGWLEYVTARIAEEDYEYDTVARHSTQALRIFERFRDSAGRARALYAAGQAAAWTGEVSAEGVPLAEEYFRDALVLARDLGDPVFEARIRIAMATASLYAGQYEEGMRRLLAVQESPRAMSDLNIRALFHVRRAWFAGGLRRDFVAAERDLVEADRVARKGHNRLNLADVKWEFALVEAHNGRYGEAARLLEEAAADLARYGSAGFAADAYFCAGMFHLAAEDRGGYERVASILKSSPFARILGNRRDRPAILCPLDALMRGDLEGFEAGFAALFREVEGVPTTSVCHRASLWQDHFYYGVALRALGREREADIHQHQALELLQQYGGVREAHLIEGDYGKRIAGTIRSMMGAA